MNKTLAKFLGRPERSVVTYSPPSPAVMEKVLLTGDLAGLDAGQRLNYYESVCRALKLNPLTKPFEYIVLNSKLTLYARKDCTEQLRRTYGISVRIISRETIEGVFTVVARASFPNGREDESVGAVFLPSTGEAKSNAIMKAETKAKRRVTLSICGLGMFDESELDSIPNEMTPEDRVKTATANRLQEKAETVTEDNYNDVICHIGKADGEMFGKRICEIHPNVLGWLQQHYGEGQGIRWGNPPDLRDSGLKEAVDIALRKLKE